MKPRRLLGAICAVLATVSVALLGAAPAAGAAEGRAPRAQLMRLLDQCDAASWNAQIPGICALPAAAPCAVVAPWWGARPARA